ncbi:glycosyltransferase family 61 protein [Rhodopirellula europaea]|nr:glycosyltransferase family 61 protein [Rhodopirellula europaea]
MAKRLLSKTVSLDDKRTYSFVHNHWSRGYHHWIVESLVRLLQLHDEASRPLTILVPEDYPGFAHQCLEMLRGRHEIAFIPANSNAKIPKALVVPNPAYKIFDPQTMESLRNWVWNSSQLDRFNVVPHRRVYISRQFAQMRRVENEREVQGFMRDEGFEIVHTENLSFDDQVRMFFETKALVGIHGAGLTNLLFMHPGTSVLEFRRSPIEGKTTWNQCFQSLALAAGVRHSLLDCDAGSNDAKCLGRANLHVNLKRLSNSLTQLG